MNRLALAFLLLIAFQAKEEILPPEPVFPIPSERQLAWHQLEYYAFVHFNMNTFADREWGFGDELPSMFDPTELDTRQWARVVKEAGMKGIIITAKYHDGFCLWPSAYTEHSVKNSPWRDGQGDLIQELKEACEEYGLKMGVYYSPWDRNHPEYGQPAYLSLLYYWMMFQRKFTPLNEYWTCTQTPLGVQSRRVLAPGCYPGFGCE